MNKSDEAYYIDISKRLKVLEKLAILGRAFNKHLRSKTFGTMSETDWRVSDKLWLRYSELLDLVEKKHPEYLNEPVFYNPIYIIQRTLRELEDE